jgi:alanine dehydrogenase
MLAAETGSEEVCMIIGVPREIKTLEFRVGLVPDAVSDLARHGHRVLVETHAGDGISVDDDEYALAGAEIMATAKEIFAAAELIVKVKEPQPAELKLLRPGQILFTYLHLAADQSLTQDLQNSGAVCIAYETITDGAGHLPLLQPMSEVAGRMSIQVGAHCLEKEAGGSGILLGGVPGVPAAEIVVLGGGTVGENAIRMAVGMEAQVTVIDRSIARLRELDAMFGSRIQTVYSTADTVARAVAKADLVVGAVLIPGAAAPRLVTRPMLRAMRRGSALVDVAIDQGGCFETSRPTTHANPTYVEEGIVHYCVTNMPGAVPRTSTFALNNATQPFVLALAEKGWRRALADDVHLRRGLNVCEGKLTNDRVAAAFGAAFVDPSDVVMSDAT